MSNIIDFKSKQLEAVDEGEVILSKKEILQNIILLLEKEFDSIDNIVIAYDTIDGNFSANSNTPKGPEIIWLLEQAKLGVLGV